MRVKLLPRRCQRRKKFPSLLQGRAARQAYLQAKHNFSCCCWRCGLTGAALTQDELQRTEAVRRQAEINRRQQTISMASSSQY